MLIVNEVTFERAIEARIFLGYRANRAWKTWDNVYHYLNSNTNTDKRCTIDTWCSRHLSGAAARYRQQYAIRMRHFILDLVEAGIVQEVESERKGIAYVWAPM